MKSVEQKKVVLQAFLHGLKLGHVLNAQVDCIADRYIGLIVPATLDGEDQEDHYGQISFDFLDKHCDISVFFDTLDERIRYAAQGCEQEAWVEAGMSLDSEHWQKQKATEEKENGDTATH